MDRFKGAGGGKQQPVGAVDILLLRPWPEHLGKGFGLVRVGTRRGGLRRPGHGETGQTRQKRC